MVASSMTFFHTTVTLNHFKVIYIFILPWKNVDRAFTAVMDPLQHLWKV